MKSHIKRRKYQNGQAPDTGRTSPLKLSMLRRATVRASDKCEYGWSAQRRRLRAEADNAGETDVYGAKGLK